MTCSTCGRENPSHLTFCQECGQRLGPRIAPPTPPIGLGGDDAYGPAPIPKQDSHHDHARVATSLGMTSRMPEPQARAHAGQAVGDRRCSICDTVNGPNLRYCTSCGSTLQAAAAPASASSPHAAPFARGAIPEPPHAITPMRVVELEAAEAPRAELRVCTRCRGTADSSAQFCKFCGNSLTDAERPGPPGSASTPNGSVRDGRAAPRDPHRAPTAPIGQVAPQVIQTPRPAEGLSSASTPHVAPSNDGPAPHASGVAALAAAQRQPEQPHRPKTPEPAAARAVSPTQQRGRLVVIAKSGADGPSYPFGDLLDVGRTEGNVIVSEDPYLSPRHVRILFQNGKFTLRDLSSTNGVFLRLAASRDTSARRSSDDHEIAVPLLDNDLILVGQQVLRFDILKEAEGGFGPAQEHGTLLFGSPAAPRYARLCQRTVEGIARDIYYVRKVETVLGRESGDVVFTEDPFLSRRHVAIRLLSRDGSPVGGSVGSRPPPGEARFTLVDLGSSNGTFLRIRGDVDLAPGDHFRVGQQLFRVDFDALHAHGARS